MMPSPQEQGRRSLGGRLDVAIQSGLLRPSVVTFELDDETDERKDSSSASMDDSIRSKISDTCQTGEETLSRNKILRRFNDYVSTPNSPLHRHGVLIRERVDKFKEKAHKQWRDRPRRCSHHIELIV